MRKLGKMMQSSALLFVIISFSISFSAGTITATDSSPSISPATLPTIKCIYHILKSSGAVQSVNVYSIDETRIGIEHAFRNKDNQVVVFDIELLSLPGRSVVASDKVPREISEKTMNDAQNFESKLDLNSKCHLTWVFDNLIPSPRARADWRTIDWPNKLH